MFNILFIHSSSELYGSDRSLLNIVKNIDRTKYRIHVVLPCQGPLVDEMKKIQDVTVTIFEVAVLRRKNLSCKGLWSYSKSFMKSIRFIKKYIVVNQIDIVDTNTAVVFPGAIAAKWCKKKSVWHIREIINNKFENVVISHIMQKYSDLIIANSEATGKALKVGKSKVRVVYNAVENTNNGIKIPHEKLIVGMAGRINRWKGQKLFIDMAELVYKQHPDALFLIAGDAYYGEEYLRIELEKYIKNKKMQDSIILLGQVNDMDTFYNNLDVFVLPSIQPEPFGLVVIEAMEHGLPVVATNHGGPVEIITNGVDGYLVPYTSQFQMAEKVNELLNDKNKRKEMGEKGIEKKQRRFSIDAMVNGVQDVFDEALRL